MILCTLCKLIEVCSFLVLMSSPVTGYGLDLQCQICIYFCEMGLRSKQTADGYTNHIHAITAPMGLSYQTGISCSLQGSQLEMTVDYSPKPPLTDYLALSCAVKSVQQRGSFHVSIGLVSPLSVVKVSQLVCAFSGKVLSSNSAGQSRTMGIAYIVL